MNKKAKIKIGVVVTLLLVISIFFFGYFSREVKAITNTTITSNISFGSFDNLLHQDTNFYLWGNNSFSPNYESGSNLTLWKNGNTKLESITDNQVFYCGFDSVGTNCSVPYTIVGTNITYNSSGRYESSYWWNNSVDTTNNYINLTGLSMNLSNSNITIMAWVYDFDYNANNENIFNGYNFASNNGTIIMQFGFNNPLQCRAILMNSSEVVAGTLSSISGVYPNEWTHIACVWDVSSKTIKGYVNGVLSVAQSFDGVLMDTTLQNLSNRIGNSNWNGSIDEIALYKRAWSQDEIQTYLAKSSKHNNNDVPVTFSRYALSIYDNVTIEYCPKDNVSAWGICQNSSNYQVKPYTTNIILNFNKLLHKISFKFGKQMGSNQDDFNLNATINNAHKDIGTNIQKIEISYNFNRKCYTQGAATYIVPLQINGTYDYKLLDCNVNATIQNGAIPLLIFAAVPSNFSQLGIESGASGKQDCPNGTMLYGFGGGSNASAYADYIANVTQHLNDTFNTNGFYLSTRNEPNNSTIYGQKCGMDAEWRAELNETWKRVKAINPNIKIGGANWYTIFNGTRSTIVNPRNIFGELEGELANISKQNLAVSGIDFISSNSYLFDYDLERAIVKNTTNSDNMDNYTLINNTRILYYDAPNSVKNLLNYYFPNNRTEYLQVEWNIDSLNSGARNGSFFASSAYASTLSWEIISNNVSGENFFGSAGVWTMWKFVADNTLWFYPTYYMKREFVRLNSNNTQIVNATSPDEYLEVLGVDKGNGVKGITIINKRGVSLNNLNISTDMDKVNTIWDLNQSGNSSLDTMIYNKSSSFNMSLYPYEVKFLLLNATYWINENNYTIGYVGDSKGTRMDDNFNVSIWFSTSTSSVKKISSNLTSDINATVSFNVTNCLIEKFTTNTSLVYLSSDPMVNCNAATGTATISNFPLVPGESVINIVYLSPGGGGGVAGYGGITNQTTVINQTNATLPNPQNNAQNGLEEALKGIGEAFDPSLTDSEKIIIGILALFTLFSLLMWATGAGRND